LQMAVREPGMGFEGGKPGGSFHRRVRAGTVLRHAGWPGE
jgi:hypothetical protein